MTRIERQLVYVAIIIGAAVVTVACALVLGLVLIGVFS